MRHGAVSEPYCGLDNLCRNDAPDFRSFYFRSRILQPPTVIRLHSVTARRLPRLRSFIYLIPGVCGRGGQKQNGSCAE